MRRVRRLVGLTAIGASLFAARVVSASLVLALDLPTMVSRANQVAVVDVQSVKSSWDARHERVYTTVDLLVVESWKGAAAPATHLSIVQRGGTVDDTEVVVFGMPRFVAGERAVVFLTGPPEHVAVVGMAQGKRVVRRDPASGRWLVHVPDRAGASFLRPSPTAAPSPVFEVQPRPLEELRETVKGLAAAPGKAP